MSVPATEQMFLGMTPPAALTDAMGQWVYQAGSDGGYGFSLVSYLTTPVPTKCRLDYVVMCHQDADAWEWTFLWGGGVLRQTSGAPIANVTVPNPGALTVRVVVKKNGQDLATLTMNQNAVGPSQPFLELEARIGSPPDATVFALREVCENFKSYIDAAATATGADGIPARLLAAVIFMEVLGRPSESSPKADVIKTSLSGEDYNPRLDEFLDKVKTAVRGRKGRTVLDDIREVELDLVREFFNDVFDDNVSWRDITLYFAVRKSIGVGQIALTTCAMTAGTIPWRDLNESTKAADLDAIDAAFRGINGTDGLAIFNALRFPKSNIFIAAQLLKKLKVRPHRFPAMTSAQVLASPQAIGILATEYNGGGFDTALASMKDNDNGRRARKFVTSPSTIGLERFFPDPP